MMKKYIFAVLLVFILAGCNQKTEEAKLSKLENAKVVSVYVVRADGTVVVDNGEEILKLDYNAFYTELIEGGIYDIYYRGKSLEGATESEEGDNQ
ncbi:membrane lipoprotein lipid attachment site-containing protein [Cytobacillus gottheilii]|uniref:Membrane lipoprotein lipid attachment site-containing protein n=1 Tax=Cytobacillus gottheilii TaxID=859144 RepID=A0ABX8FFY1_9BACI|nr:membrane lipoprotein lipid attachment site-containing protein [Cytobacillus gottheilii]QVY62943.1 membrane lipoprotein lipid attachment site-containing protein [Cytobacillus gottheilii]